MQGAAREKGDPIHPSKHRAGEKGVEGGSKTREGATMQLETAERRRPRKQETKDVSHSDASFDVYDAEFGSRAFLLTKSAFLSTLILCYDENINSGSTKPAYH